MSGKIEATIDNLAPAIGILVRQRDNLILSFGDRQKLVIARALIQEVLVDLCKHNLSEKITLTMC